MFGAFPSFLVVQVLTHSEVRSFVSRMGATRMVIVRNRVIRKRGIKKRVIRKRVIKKRVIRKAIEKRIGEVIHLFPMIEVGYEGSLSFTL